MLDVSSQKAMYLVGKHGDICDIVLENPTISRKHAVFQGKNTDEIFVYDLGSTHGTFVNNRKITSKLYHKLTIHD
jgi:pSer/pThr/pTyr-binding forkhead associated (FHA) protein